MSTTVSANHDKSPTEATAVASAADPPEPGGTTPLQRPRSWRNSFGSSFILNLYRFALHESQAPNDDTEKGPDPSTSTNLPLPSAPPPQNEASSNGEPDKLRNMDVFWEQYGKEAEASDREMVGALGSGLDALLVFAGLFSAINTAFIIESYQDLKPDPAESGGTNDLLRALIYATNQTTIDTPTFTAPPSAVASNFFFFASLCCSLFSAFGAVLGKQWLSEYERVGEKPLPYERGLQRHSKYLAMKNSWCEPTIQLLGTVLQASLFLFLIALTNWLWNINRVMGGLVIAGTIVTALFFLITTYHSLFRDYSPYSTRFSSMLREIWAPSDELKPAASGQSCIVWLRKHATSFQSVRAMSEAWTRCEWPKGGDDLSHRAVSSELIGAIVSSDAITAGSEDGTLFSTVRAIKRVKPWYTEEEPTESDEQVVHGLKLALRRAQEKDVQDPVLCEMIVSSLPRTKSAPWRRVLSDDPIDRNVLVDICSSPLVGVEGRSIALSYLWEDCLPDLERKLPSALAEGESWPWKIAAALVKDASLEMTPEASAVCRDFRLHWAISLGQHALNGTSLSAPFRKTWKELFLSDSFDLFIASYKKKYVQTDPYYWGRLVLFCWVAHRHEMTSLVQLKECDPSTYHYYIFDVLLDREWKPYIVTAAMTDMTHDIESRISQTEKKSASELRHLLFGPLLWWYHMHRINRGDRQRSTKKTKRRRTKEQDLVSADYLRVVVYNLREEFYQKVLTPWMIRVIHDAVFAYALAVEELEQAPPTSPLQPGPSSSPSIFNQQSDRALLDRAFFFLLLVHKGETTIGKDYQPLYMALREALRVVTRGATTDIALTTCKAFQGFSDDGLGLFGLPADNYWARQEPQSETGAISMAQHLYFT